MIPPLAGAAGDAGAGGVACVGRPLPANVTASAKAIRLARDAPPERECLLAGSRGYVSSTKEERKIVVPAVQGANLAVPSNLTTAARSGS
jgi:hypothetical protein